MIYYRLSQGKSKKKNKLRQNNQFIASGTGPFSSFSGSGLVKSKQVYPASSYDESFNDVK